MIFKWIVITMIWIIGFFMGMVFLAAMFPGLGAMQEELDDYSSIICNTYKILRENVDPNTSGPLYELVQDDISYIDCK